VFFHEYENVSYVQLSLEPHRIVVQGDAECIGYFHFVPGRNSKSVCDKMFLMFKVKRGDGLQQLVKSRLTDNMLLVETFDIRKYLLTL